VNCLIFSFLESTQLSPQFQKFAMQCIALARHLLSQLLDPEAEPPLAHNRRDGKNRSG
jgi:hypothetical protein